MGKIDTLINNAGVIAGKPRAVTKQGYDLMFGTNHLGHFALVAHVMPSLLEAPAAKIVHLGSTTHRGAKLDFDHLATPAARSFRAYGRSKLAVMLFAFELDRRLREAGLPVRSLAAHPGYGSGALTPQRGDIVKKANPVFTNIVRFIGHGKDAGAQSIVRAAIEGDGGSYWGPDGLFNQRGKPVQQAPSDNALDHDVAARLWRASEELTGVEFPDLESVPE